MTMLFTPSEDTSIELAAACKRCGITVIETVPAILYTTAEDPRTALAALQAFLFAHTTFRERSVRPGGEEAYLTVLDPIDRTTTIKIRRLLPR